MGFIPDGPDGERFRRDMRAFGAASSFATAASIGIFCTAKFFAAAPGSGYAWLAGGVLGFGAAVGCVYELKAYFGNAGNGGNDKKPPPAAPPPSPSSPFMPKL
jgi:hypothetical protein